MYVSYALDDRRVELREHFTDPDHEFYMPREFYDSDEEYEEAIREELELRDYYTAKNVFWVPPLARWEVLREYNKLPFATEIQLSDGSSYEFRNTSRLLDAQNGPIENDNPRLTNIL